MMESIWYNVSVIVSALEAIGVDFKENISGDSLSTLRCGGNIPIVVFPKDALQLKNVIELLKSYSFPFYVIGNGSNTLIKDCNFSYALISLKGLKEISFFESGVLVDSGVSAPFLSQLLAKNNLAGFEKLSGIPGSLGGLVVKNAGCYGMEISELLEEIIYLDLNTLEYETALRKEIPFSYRSTGSYFKDKIVLKVKLKLTQSQENLFESILEYKKKRLSTQPTEPSLGSVFKKVDNVGAGYYIDKAGLKGVTIGGAMISNKHANFFVNVGGATPNDYLSLVKLAKDVTYNKFKITLQEEIDILGDITIGY